MKVDVLAVLEVEAQYLNECGIVRGLCPSELERFANLVNARAAFADLIAERDRLRGLAAICYAGLVAECDLPDEWADALLAASQGDAFDTDGLLPFTRGEP